MNKKILITAVVVIVLIAGVFLWQTQGDFFKGYIKLYPKNTTVTETTTTTTKDTQKIQYVEKKPYLKFTLSESSPSGSRTVNVSDKVMIFKACASNKAVALEGFEFQFRGNAVFDTTPIFGNTIVSVKDDLNNEILVGYTVHGAYTTSEVNVTVSTSKYTIAKNSCREFSVYADTQDIITQSVNDDKLTLKILSAYDNINALTTVQGNLPLSGNEIRY